MADTSAQQGTFLNPILPGFNPDPSIIRVGKDFFCTTSTFEYFPGAPIYHSQDLIQWKLIGHALTRKSQLDIKTVEPGGGVWATTIRYNDGWYYITTGVFDRYRPQQNDRVWPRGFYVRTKDIWDSASWSDPVYFDQPGFDQDVSKARTHLSEVQFLTVHSFSGTMTARRICPQLTGSSIAIPLAN